MVSLEEKELKMHIHICQPNSNNIGEMVIRILLQKVLQCTMEDLRSKSRKDNLSKKRAFFCYILKHDDILPTQHGVESLGELIHKNHSSISYYSKTINNLLDIEDRYIQDLMTTWEYYKKIKLEKFV